MTITITCCSRPATLWSLEENKMFGVATFNLPNYKELADITDSSKIEYCQRHGYSFYALRDSTYCPDLGYNKIYFTLNLFKNFSDLEWLLFSECDAMITNQSIGIENKIDNNFHFIITMDVNGINSGNFLARNTREGRDYLQMIIDQYRPGLTEQEAISNTYRHYPKIVKSVPQRYMNSYECLYGQDIRKDFEGNPGEWQSGDWIVHWPGLGLQNRFNRATEFIKLIVK